MKDKNTNTPPICVGTGLIVLDAIVNGDQSTTSDLYAGGSCGNVLAILSYLGWSSWPIVRLGNDSAGEIVLNDLKRFKVNLDFINHEKKIDTPIIFEKIYKKKDGNPTHTFLWICPSCGAWLPRYRPITLNLAKKISPKIPGIQCFYFDRISPAALTLARQSRENGALVFFEPPSIKNTDAFKKAFQISHIIKFAHSHESDIARLINEISSDSLIIETLGVDGLRFKYLGASEMSPNWNRLSSFPVSNIKDAAGAGDWCSAGIIHILSQNGYTSFREKLGTHIEEALQFGQAMAALNCQFEGARGVMYELSKSEFTLSVEQILNKNYVLESSQNMNYEKNNNVYNCICPGCKRKK